LILRYFESTGTSRINSKFAIAISRSKTTTSSCCRAKDIPRFAAIVVFPTPPFPEATTITLAILSPDF